jgi:glycosyltransferase involved in cell wall biosynthesis
MKPTGGTLLQLHYHDRPGGVSTVMRRYADAFAYLCRGRPHANLIVCSAASGTKTLCGSARIVDVRDCDYRMFGTRDQFQAARGRIMRALLSNLDRKDLPRPIVVIGHNMNLGKNCALSSAFAETARLMARLMASGDGVRFFSVVHDFAEEGRTDLLLGIQRALGFGVDIWEDLYPGLPNLRFVTPHPRTLAVLKKAGYPVTLLSNPLGILQKNFRGPRLDEVRARIRAIAKKEKVRLDLRRPVVLYPSRVISRKNPVEAVLVAHVILKSNLLLGARSASGASAKDKSLYAALKSLSVEYGIPVVFDAARIAKGREPFSLLYRFADLCITTSVAEGFGYAIHEPALYGHEVIGRCPDGFPAADKRNLPGLYKRLFIPAAWVRMDAFRKRYYRELKAMPACGNRKLSSGFASFSKSFDAAFLTAGKKGVDFGCLDLSTQLSVLRHCVLFPQAAEEWKQMFPSQTQRILASVRTSIRAFREPSATAIASENFEKRFSQCFFGSHRTGMQRIQPDPRKVQEYFCKIEHFRLLMTPQLVDDTGEYTVFA